MSRYGVISGPYFPVFGLNAGKYGLEITPYLDTFYALKLVSSSLKYIEAKTHLENVTFVTSMSHKRLRCSTTHCEHSVAIILV